MASDQGFSIIDRKKIDDFKVTGGGVGHSKKANRLLLLGRGWPREESGNPDFLVKYWFGGQRMVSRGGKKGR